MVPADLYVRPMLMQHHRRALLPDSRIPAWERREAALGRILDERRGRLWLAVLRLRPAHDGP
jgi:hypothetical protein